MWPNNNNAQGSQDSYNNMTADQVSQHAELAAKMSSTNDTSSMRRAPVTRMPSNVTMSTSRQTSATYVSGSSRQTSGTRLTATTQDSDGSQRTNETRSASRQQSQHSVNTLSSTSTSGMRQSAAGSSRSTSTIMHAPSSNMSRNNNINASPESLSTSAAGQHDVHSESTSDLPVGVHYPQQRQQQQEQTMCDVDAQQSPTAAHADHNNVCLLYTSPSPRDS